MPSYITPVDVTPTVITATPAPAAIPYHASVTTIPAHVANGTKNGSDINSSDGILEIIDMEIPPDSNVTLSYLHAKIHNSLSQVQGYLQEEIEVAGIPNTVSATSEPSFLELADRTINDIPRRM